MRLKSKGTDACQIFVYSFISILVFFTFSNGQTVLIQKTEKSKPLSVCELLKNKKNFDGKEITINGTFEFAAENSVLVVEYDCPFDDSIIIEISVNFESVNSSEMQKKFKDVTDLRSAIESNQIGLDKNEVFGGFLRVEMVAKGVFIKSKKRKFGHLNSYKSAFEITVIKEIKNSKLIPIKI